MISANRRFSPEAGNIWQSYAENIRDWLLNQVWCGYCQKLSSITCYSGKIESGLLVLRGKCVQCDGDMVRITGTPKLRSLWYKFFAKRKIEHILESIKTYPER